MNIRGSMIRQQVISNVQEQEVLELAKDLVRIPTVNPPGEEGRAREYLVKVLDDAGFQVDVVDVEPNRPNIVATYYGGYDGPTVVFNGHSDVVPAGDGWSVDPFAAIVRNGRLIGRGAADMKAGLASMIHGATSFIRANPKHPGTIILAIVMGEEWGQIGTRKLVEEGLQGTYGLVGEPTQLRPVIAHKGTLRFEITTHGKAAHGSTPELGINAIDAMGEVLLHLRKLASEMLDSPKHPLVGGPTLNVGTISGGLGTCIVPDSCTISLDWRAVPGEPLDLAEPRLNQLLQSVASQVPNFRGEVRSMAVCPPMEISPNVPIVAALRRACKDLLGMDPGYEGWTATADANLMTNDAKIPTVIFGPGSLSEAHRPDESISLDEITNAARIYALTLYYTFNSEPK